MPHSLVAGAMALALSSALSACALNTGNSNSTSPTSDFIIEVQTLALTACAFEPTADTIAKIWLAESGAAAGAEALANLTARTVCEAYASLISQKSTLKNKAHIANRGGSVDFGSVIINGHAVEIIGRLRG